MFSLLRSLVLILGKTVTDLVVVALLGHENVDTQAGLSRAIERTHCDSNPVLFDRVTFPQLQELTGDVGGRPVLTAYARADRVERVAVNEPGVLLDIDSPQDLPRE